MAQAVVHGYYRLDHVPKKGLFLLVLIDQPTDTLISILSGKFIHLISIGCQCTDYFVDSRAQVLENPSDRSALKGFISGDALVHPDHPFNAPNPSKQPGVTLTIGIESNAFLILLSVGLINLFLQGTLENGESRLLYTSKQVEYTRYWLHATGYTEEPIPLPGSTYLITDSSLKNTYPVTFNTMADLKNALKVQAHPYPLCTLFVNSFDRIS